MNFFGKARSYMFMLDKIWSHYLKGKKTWSAISWMICFWSYEIYRKLIICRSVVFGVKDVRTLGVIGFWGFHIFWSTFWRLCNIQVLRRLATSHPSTVVFSNGDIRRENVVVHANNDDQYRYAWLGEKWILFRLFRIPQSHQHHVYHRYCILFNCTFYPVLLILLRMRSFAG